MRLLKAKIENFKLLENVSIVFSTNQQQPLTVIRAENGSGKTSLLYALHWAFYGMAGLPVEAQGLRRLRSAVPSGIPVLISVMIEFDHHDDAGEVAHYRLIRSVTETPGDGDKVDRQQERLRLLRIVAAGEEGVANAEAVIGKMIPLRLRDIFFTNGDDVQRFISGRVSTQQRQSQVHLTIKALLGLETLRIGLDDIDSVYKRLRAEAAKAGGADTSSLEEGLEKTDGAITTLASEVEKLTESLNAMSEQKAKWDKELNALKGIGNLEELNAQIERLGKDQKRHEDARSRSLQRMRSLIKSDAFSWSVMERQLEAGLARLSELSDRRIIPGTSIEVLNDRLDLEECICAEPLPRGSERRTKVEALRDQQSAISESRQRLTSLFHTSKQAKAVDEARESTFEAQRAGLLAEFMQTRDALAEVGRLLDIATEKRGLIDDSRVRELTERLGGLDAKVANANANLGESKAKMEMLSEKREEQVLQLRSAEKAVKISGRLATRRDVAQDLLELVKGTLKVLEGDYVQRVSTRMNDLFMEIVGSHPDFEAGVFTGVHIDASYNIIVDTHGGRRLDTDFELNGASQRALTLAFIWALMEVSAFTAPRIIDTPLGMVAGGVKSRMVDVITRPSAADAADFQVVLLLTRSEIRDIEELLDVRAGVVSTLSCSKDYPTDLRFSWEADHPLVRSCTCSHRQSCRICARQYDERHGITFRDEEAAV